MKRAWAIALILVLVTIGSQWTGAKANESNSKETNRVEVKSESINDTQKIASVKENTQDISDAIANQASLTFVYIPNQIYKVYCQEQRITDVQLQPGEEIIYVGAGDTVRWVVDQEVSGSGETMQWHVYIKPLKAGIKTNFIINTNKHIYHLEVVATNWYTPIVNWCYPREERAALIRQRAAQERRAEETIARFQLNDLNFEYKIVSSRSYRWKPQMVFDDGVKTYIQMPPSMKSSEAPALFIKDDDGLQLVNYRVRNDYYIVDRLFEEAELRNGKEIVRIKKTDKSQSLDGR